MTGAEESRLTGKKDATQVTLKMEAGDHKLRNTGSHQKPEEARDGFFPKATREHGLANTLLQLMDMHSGFLASRMVKEFIFVVLSLQVCCSSHRKLTQKMKWEEDMKQLAHYLAHGRNLRNPY